MANSFLKHLLIVTSLTPHTNLTSSLEMLRLQDWAMKNIMPAAIEWGVLSVIICSFSILVAKNFDNIVSSVFIFNRLQNRSMKDAGVEVSSSV